MIESDRANLMDSERETALVSLLPGLNALGHEAALLVRDHLQLAVAETRLAVQALVGVLVAGIVLAFILLTVWLGLSALGVFYLLNSGLDLGSAILGLVAVNIVIVGILVVVMRRQFAFINLESTIASLSGNSPGNNISENLNEPNRQ
jgi:Putative Actinobacterial Holin-X, holin superfamily III